MNALLKHPLLCSLITAHSALSPLHFSVSTSQNFSFYPTAHWHSLSRSALGGNQGRARRPSPTAAAEWSIRYLPDFRLPDKALDLVDQACAAASFQTLTPNLQG
jgi:AAA lid domain